MAGKFKNIMETSAVYWESKTKIFGFREVFNVSLLTATIATEKVTPVESFWGNLNDSSEIDFHLVLIQTLQDNTTHFSLVFDRKWEEKIQQYCKPILHSENKDSCLIRSPVELIYFFGPHFNERYGIADTTFKILAENNLSFLAAGFSGSSVYLVFPENGIEKVRPFLSEAFEVPKSK